MTAAGEDHPKVIAGWRDATGALWDEHPDNLMSRVDAANGEDQLVPAAEVRRNHGPLSEVWPASQGTLFDVRPSAPVQGLR